jgi:hypothetical protein
MSWNRRVAVYLLDRVGYGIIIVVALAIYFAKNKARAEEDGLWAGRGGGYEIGNTILWQDGTTTRRIGNAWISNDGQTLYQIRNYWVEISKPK